MKFSRMFLFMLMVLVSGMLSACGQVNISNFPSLVLKGDKVYLSEGLQVYALNVASGQETMVGDKPLRYPLESKNEINIFAPAAFTEDGQIIYANSSTSHHELLSSNLDTGATNWSFSQSKGTWIAGPIVLNNVIFAPGGDGVLYAIDTKGATVWEQKLSDYGLWSTPVTDGKLIFQVVMEGKLVALDSETGKIAWQVELDDVLASSPLVSDGVLYLGTIGGKLHAMQAATGENIWTQQLEGSIWSHPILNDGTLYIGSMVEVSGRFYALNASDGSKRWEPQVSTGSVLASPVIVGNQVIYVTDSGRVQALNLETGVATWKKDIKGKLVTTPVFSNDTLMIAVVGGDYYLVALTTTSADKWTFKP